MEKVNFQYLIIYQILWHLISNIFFSIIVHGHCFFFFSSNEVYKRKGQRQLSPHVTQYMPDIVSYFLIHSVELTQINRSITLDLVLFSRLIKTLKTTVAFQVLTSFYETI